jgi:hypothetical protein
LLGGLLAVIVAEPHGDDVGHRRVMRPFPFHVSARPTPAHRWHRRGMATPGSVFAQAGLDLPDGQGSPVVSTESGWMRIAVQRGNPYICRAQGLTSTQRVPSTAARTLGLSERTVESHVRSILTRTGLTTRTELTRWCLQQPRR